MTKPELHAVCMHGFLVWSDNADEYSELGAFRHKVDGKPARMLTVQQQRELFQQQDAGQINPDKSLETFRDIARYVEQCVHAGCVVPQRKDQETLLDGQSFQWMWCLPRANYREATQSKIEGVETFVEQYTDGYIRFLIQDMTPKLNAHPVIRALHSHTDDNQPYPQISRTFETWYSNMDRTDDTRYEFLVRLNEPTDSDHWVLECAVRDPQGEIRLVSANLGNKDILAAGIKGQKTLTKTYLGSFEWELGHDGFSYLLTTNQADTFINKGVNKLREAGIIVMLPKEWVKLKPEMKISVTSGVEATPYKQLGIEHMADFKWEVALGDMKLTEQEIKEAVRQKSSLIRIRNQWVQLDGSGLRAAARYIKNHQGQPESLGEALRTVQEVKEIEGIEAEVAADGWIGDFLNGTMNESIRPVKQPRTLKATLRPYQNEGLNWLSFMSRHGLGVILADDMGLGKTIQLISLILHEKKQKLGPNLVVCPMSVVGNWQNELEKFGPSLKVYVHHGTERLKGKVFLDAVSRHDAILTTYTLLSKDIELFRQQAWNRVTLDEAQYIKNHNTAQARAARSLKARHRVALTGTPVENKLMELRSIMDFVNPGMFGTKKDFHERYAKPIERHADQQVLKKLRHFIEPFVLRRTKTDKNIVPELPEKMEQTLRTSLTVEQASLYEATVHDMLMRIDNLPAIERKALVLTTLMRLKQICNHPAHFLSDNSGVLAHDSSHRSGKLEALEDLITNVLGEGHKAIVFTQFTEFGTMLQPYLEERFGTKVPFLHGGVSKKKRDAMVAEFQAEEEGSPQVMLLSLKAGGIGLNLTAANHVIHVDRWWNPAVENQATDRAFRIGQEKDVQVYKMLTSGTVEERIAKVIESKKHLADMVVSNSQGWITELDTDSLRELFSLEGVGEK